MYVLVIANPFDTATRIGYHYLKRFAGHAQKQGYDVILQKTPDLKTLAQLLLTYNPKLVVANGHGGYKSLTVGDQILIAIKSYDEATGRKVIGENPEWFAGRIVLLLTCNAGKELAYKLVDHGAKAALGFKQPFIFMSDESRDPSKDKLAKPFFVSMLQTGLQMVRGKTFGEACRVTRETFAYYTELAEGQGDENSAKYLSFDAQNLVCVGDAGSRI